MREDGWVAFLGWQMGEGAGGWVGVWGGIFKLADGRVRGSAWRAGCSWPDESAVG